MSNIPDSYPSWLVEWMARQKITLWGAADLRDFSTPMDKRGQRFPFALSWAIPVQPRIMATVRQGPNRSYAEEYARLNRRINDLSDSLAAELSLRGFRSLPLAASDRTDTVRIKGDFPHKTAATRAGLGWIGRHCQLITREFGSWVRLGTVFTDMMLPCGPSMDRNFCGRCRRCVEACPADALTGRAWSPMVVREQILDVRACDKWKKRHYYQLHKGHICGICSAVCPYGSKALKRTPGKA